MEESVDEQPSLPSALQPDSAPAIRLRHRTGECAEVLELFRRGQRRIWPAPSELAEALDCQILEVPAPFALAVGQELAFEEFTALLDGGCGQIADGGFLEKLLQRRP